MDFLLVVNFYKRKIQQDLGIIKFQANLDITLQKKYFKSREIFFQRKIRVEKINRI